MAASKGFGSGLYYLASTGPDVWTKLADVTKCRPHNKKADVIDSSSMDSAAETREKIPGMIDSGDCTFDLNWNWVNTTHLWLEANVGVDGKQFKYIGRGTAPTKPVRLFSGFITSVSPEVPFDGKQTCSASVAISGPVTASADGS